MKIDVWSDFVCPFCYIGKRRLEIALEQFPYKDQVKVEFKSFELDPNSPTFNGTGINEILAAKYGMSIEEAIRANVGVGQQAATVGLTFNFDEMKPTNTFDAHRLAKYAKVHGKEREITEKLLYGYFSESNNLSDQETLLNIAEEVGLERQATLEVLQDKKAYANDVRLDERIAQQYGVRGVPYFVINQKYAISGAQPIETFIRALEQVWKESASNDLQDISSESTEDSSCIDGNCMIPRKN